MAEDTYPEELYIADFDVYDYDEGTWDSLLALMEREEEEQRDSDSEQEYDADLYGYDEEGETEQADDWEWFDR